MKVKNVVLVLGIMTCVLFNASIVNAQMPTAKTPQPDIVKGVSLNASLDEVWTVLSQPQQFKEFVPGISNFKSDGNDVGSTIWFSIPNDKSRQQKLTFLNKDRQLIVYFVTKSDYVDESWIFRLTVGADEDKCFVQYEVMFDSVNKREKKELKALVEKEWLLIKKGLESKFNS